MNKILKTITVNPLIWKTFSKVVEAYKKKNMAKSMSSTLEEFMVQYIKDATKKGVKI